MVAIMVFKAELIRLPLRHCLQFLGFSLRQVNHPLVVSEIHGQQLWLPIQTQSPDYQAIKVLYEEIREIETARLLFRQLVECLAAGVKLITVRTGNSFDAIFFEKEGLSEPYRSSKMTFWKDFILRKYT